MWFQTYLWYIIYYLTPSYSHYHEWTQELEIWMGEQILVLLNKFWNGWGYWQHFDTSAINEQWTPKVEDIWNYSAHFCFQSMAFWQADTIVQKTIQIDILTRKMTIEMKSLWMWTGSRHRIHNQRTWGCLCLSAASLVASLHALFLSSELRETNTDPSFWWNSFFEPRGISRDLSA